MSDRPLSERVRIFHYVITDADADEIAALEAENKRLLKEVFTAHENEAMSIRACDCLDCTAYRRGQG